MLASVASYRVSDADTGGHDPAPRIDAVRISPMDGRKFQLGPEVWLGWHPESQTWQLWDDPRSHYGGPPIDVVNPGQHIEPEQWDTAHEAEAINSHDTQGLQAIGADETALDGQEWTEKWTGESLLDMPDHPSLEP